MRLTRATCYYINSYSISACFVVILWDYFLNITACFYPFEPILLPNQVIGLEDMLVEYLNGNPMAPTVAVCSAFPNPCNPQTTVEMQISEHTTPADPASAVLEIFNIRGERVKMTRGGQYRNNRIAISWTGIDDNGQSCSSGKYFYRLTWSGVVGSGSIALIK